jgi:hypothetical protein
MVAATKRFFPRMLFAAAALFAVGALTGYPVASPVSVSAALFDAPACPVRIPEALRAANVDSPAPLTSIVWVDIDGDGDIDVAATDATLNLFLWVNDGAGHLTRQRPAPASTRWADSDSPRVDGQRPTPRMGLQPHAHRPPEPTVVLRVAQGRRIFSSFDAHAKSFAKCGTLRGPPFPRSVRNI